MLAAEPDSKRYQAHAYYILILEVVSHIKWFNNQDIVLYNP